MSIYIEIFIYTYIYILIFGIHVYWFVVCLLYVFIHQKAYKRYISSQLKFIKHINTHTYIKTHIKTHNSPTQINEKYKYVYRYTSIHIYIYVCVHIHVKNKKTYNNPVTTNKISITYTYQKHIKHIITYKKYTYIYMYIYLYL